MLMLSVNILFWVHCFDECIINIIKTCISLHWPLQMLDIRIVLFSAIKFESSQSVKNVICIVTYAIKNVHKESVSSEAKMHRQCVSVGQRRIS